jgi:hypothetical protein
LGANEMRLVPIVPISREECSLPWRKICEAGTWSVVEIQGRPWLMVCRVGVDDVSQLDWKSEYRRSVLRGLGCCHFVILWHCAFLNHDVMFAWGRRWLLKLSCALVVSVVELAQQCLPERQGIGEIECSTSCGL